MQKTKTPLLNKYVDVWVSLSPSAVSHPVFCFPTGVTEVYFVIFFLTRVHKSARLQKGFLLRGALIHG